MATVGLDLRIELEQARERLDLDIQHASLLEARQRENEKALAQMQSDSALICVGKEAFISMPIETARATLKRENERLHAETEKLQMRITKQARELEEMEESARAILTNAPID